MQQCTAQVTEMFFEHGAQSTDHQNIFTA